MNLIFADLLEGDEVDLLGDDEVDDAIETPREVPVEIPQVRCHHL